MTSRPLAGRLRSAAILVALVGATFVHLLRQRGVPLWDSVWAEDGSVFLTDALRDFSGTFFDQNGGYVHVVPRLVAVAAAALPVDAAAAAMSAGAAVVIALIAGFTYVATSAVLRSRAARLGVAASVALVPVPGSDLLGNATNLHFYLLFACFWALFWQSQTIGALVSRSTVVLASTLSDPLSTLFLPLAVVAPVVRREGRSLIVPGFFLIGLAVQLGLMWGGEAPRRNWGFALIDVLDIFSLRVTGGMLVGDRFLDDGWLEYGRAFSYGALLFVTVVVALLMRRSDRPTAAFALISLAYAGLFFCVQLVGRGTGGTDPDLGSFHLNGARYVLLPFLFTTAALLALVDRRAAAHGDAVSVWARRVALLWLAAVLVVNYSLVTDRSSGPRWGRELTNARRSCSDDATDAARILVAPTPPRVWFAEVPCERL
jgi:hypothetical protein